MTDTKPQGEKRDVHLEVRGAVHVITIDREEVRNALNESVAAGIKAGLDTAEADPDCRAVVLTGRGDRAFCAGGDLKSTSGDTPFTFEPSEPRNFIVALFERMGACRLPIIARVNGHALAGGLGLLCACDMAVSTDRAKFGTPESGIGIFPMMILPYMMRVLPARKLMEFCITGEAVDAHEALALGLVNHVAPAAELDAKLDWLLERTVNKSPTGIRLGKMAFRAMRDMTLNQSLEYAQVMLAMMTQTRDATEGIVAFREKRKPSWTGK
jgi:enoyl-CoA hydratase/carnithine racemase